MVITTFSTPFRRRLPQTSLLVALVIIIVVINIIAVSVAALASCLPIISAGNGNAWAQFRVWLIPRLWFPANEEFHFLHSTATRPSGRTHGFTSPFEKSTVTRNCSRSAAFLTGINSQRNIFAAEVTFWQPCVLRSRKNDLANCSGNYMDREKNFLR